jgi:mRNA-degrading endonuclease toxin of MazEF toxin-antitoxin module
MTVNRGYVVLLNYPFSSGRGTTIRPAVVVQSDKNNSRPPNTIVAMITRSTQRAQHEPTLRPHQGRNCYLQFREVKRHWFIVGSDLALKYALDMFFQLFPC